MTGVGIVDSAGVTETGRVRRSNEDSYLMRGTLFMVADGMGGAAAGEIASAICAEAFAEIDLIRTGGDTALRDAIRTANRRIVERAASDPSAAGMGTTVTAALIGDDGRVVIANVGDSRAYLLRDGNLRRLSEDHSVVAELIASGQISEDEAEHHPQRSVITRVLGAEPTVQVDIFWLDAADGDMILLCSDGLTTMVPEATDRRAAGRRGGMREDRAVAGGRGAGGGRRGQRDRGRVPDRPARREHRRHAARDPHQRSRPGAGRTRPAGLPTAPDAARTRSRWQCWR